MRIPYGCTSRSGGIIEIDPEKITTVQAIFNYYLNGARLGKVVDMLISKKIPSPTGNQMWTRASVDKLLSNAKYIPVVGESAYLDVQYEKAARCKKDITEVVITTVMSFLSLGRNTTLPPTQTPTHATASLQVISSPAILQAISPPAILNCDKPGLYFAIFLRLSELI